MLETELMPRLLVGNTEPGGGKLKKGNGFLKPNFGGSSELASKAIGLIIWEN